MSSSAKVVPLTCHGHSRPVTHLSFSSIVDDDQYYLISGCKDNNPMLRDGVTGDWIGTFIGHKGAVWQSRLSSDATYAATGSADFTAKVWDTHSGECLHTMQHSHIVRSVAFSPGTTPMYLATGGFEKKLRVYNLSRSSSDGSNASSPAGVDGSASNPPLYELGTGIHGGAIKSIVWGPELNLLVSASEDKAIRWWDMRAESAIATYVLDGPLGSCELSNLATTPGYHNSILAVGAGSTAHFFSGTTPGQLIKSVKTPHDIASVAINYSENKFVVGGGSDTWVRVYSFDEGKELTVHKGHHGPVWSTSFSPDGKLYATGSEDGTIKLWKFCNDAYGLWR